MPSTAQTAGQTIVIIGAGPVGLYAAFQAGLRGLRPVIIEAMGGPGGQCAALYPDRTIYDAPANPEITAGALAQNLSAQVNRFAPVTLYGRRATAIWGSLESGFSVETDTGETITGAAVVFAGGAGALRPRPLNVDGMAEIGRDDLSYDADAKEASGRHVAVIGDGAAAIDLALEATSRAASVSLIHAQPFRAEAPLIKDLSRAAAQRRLRVIRGDVAAVKGAGGRLSKIEVEAEGQRRAYDADLLLVQAGLEFAGTPPTGLTSIEDPATGETQVNGVYIVGDAVAAPSRPPVIAAGFAEALRAVEAAHQRIAPDAPRALPHTAASPTLRARLNVA